MRRALNFWIVGGDMRQAKLAGLLAEDGHTVHRYAMERAPGLPMVADARTLDGAALADCVIFPLPMLGEGSMINAPLSQHEQPLARVLDALRPGQFLCGGKTDPEAQDLAHRRGLELHDYFAREELAVANAVPTAEGAVQIAMEELPFTLHGARVLVLGFGRVGKLTAHRMAALGAKVSVAARRFSDLAWIEAYGYGVEHSGQLAGFLCGYDLIVNTVPVRILTEERLAELKEGCLIIDLASRPGGVDFEAAGEMGVKAIWSLSLPGKVAPVTAGRAIRDTIYNMLSELGV